ncbi:arylsulfatase J-like [Hyposmocoma kahamanoa]|uniref:arylsulfatase J-like n=1 Tax=Hyposmocoma kahamanoa TaxID=1477025 RepID=UPI000E6D956E|nr:arylsulfatase J-like [Hyposmocoma kahamanoa]
MRMASMYGLVFSLAIISYVSVFCKKISEVPNIVFIVADDLGWDDVSFHGSEQVLTPNIDLLAYTGVALERFYSHSVCTPSRAALLTGKYAYTMGMHGYPLTNAEDRGLPINEKILPQYLKTLGYATHLIGKWHLGHSRSEYFPNNRGFDSYFGHRGGFIDYYEYTCEETWRTGPVSGLDLFRNTSAAWDVEGYITDIYTKEAVNVVKNHDKSKPLFLMVSHNAPHAGNNGALLQAPPATVRSMRHVESQERRIFSAMVKKLDDSVGDIIESLSDKQMLNNTIILFLSDNGGAYQKKYPNFASNWPLRGTKFSPFEGGQRVVGLVWSPLVNTTNHLLKGFVHAVDWLPTILTAAGLDPPTEIDGIDQWNSILNNEDSIRNEIFDIYDDNHAVFKSAIIGDFKLITGVVEEYDYKGGDVRGIIGKGPSYVDAIKTCKMHSILYSTGIKFDMNDINLRNDIRVKCKNTEYNMPLCIPDNDKVCLYNIKEDPCEKRDLSSTHPDIVRNLLSRLQIELKRTKERVWPLIRDPRGRPSAHNYTWTSWADNLA